MGVESLSPRMLDFNMFAEALWTIFYADDKTFIYSQDFLAFGHAPIEAIMSRQAEPMIKMGVFAKRLRETKLPFKGKGRQHLFGVNGLDWAITILNNHRGTTERERKFDVL